MSCLTQLTIHSLSLECAQKPERNVVVQLDQPGELERLAKTPLSITEGTEYAMVIRFSCVP